MSKTGSKYTDREIINRLITAHNSHDSERRPFNNSALRASDSKLASYLDRQRIRWVDALLTAGLDPSCHISQFNYGKTIEQKQETHKRILTAIAENYGISSLNDNAMNSESEVSIDLFPEFQSQIFPICDAHGCKPFQLTRRSIYATGRRLHGNWESALNAAGIDINLVRRKIASRDFGEILQLFDQFDKQTKGNWTITSIRETSGELAKAIYNLKGRKNLNIPFGNCSDNLTYVTWINLTYWRETGVLEENLDWYETRKNELEKQFKAEHRGQEDWDENSIILGLQSIYAKGHETIRLSREDIFFKGDEDDKRIWSAMRQIRFRNAGITETEWCNKSGILIDNLRKKYQQIDERYSVEDCLNYFSERMRESLQDGENRLTREFNQKFDPDFTNFIINKYASWEKGLEDHGLDPKFFSITASKRTRRGYRFQKFFEETLLHHGFVSVSQDPRDNEFVANQSIPTCTHDIKCKPDFLFSNLIIDTKTGYHASQKPEQLKRYYDHIPNVLILTLNDGDRWEIIEGAQIRVVGFRSFIQQSEQILGVKLDSSLPSQLSKVLKAHPFWG